MFERIYLVNLLEILETKLKYNRRLSLSSENKRYFCHRYTLS